MVRLKRGVRDFRLGSFENRTVRRFHVDGHPSAAICTKKWSMPDFIRQLKPVHSLIQLLPHVDPFTGRTDEVIHESEDFHSWGVHREF